MKERFRINLFSLRMRRDLQKLGDQLSEMEQKIPFLDSMEPSVSKVPVAWHLAHNIKVINSVISGLKYSDPGAYRKTFSWKKELIYLFGRIPRGKARAPKGVLPEADLSAEDLQNEIEKTKKRILEIPALPQKTFFEHPFFGHVPRDESPKFLVIHTEHHLKIIRDIIKDS